MINFAKYQYENVFEVTKETDDKKIKQIWARLYDPETKESHLFDVTAYSVPSLYFYNKNGEYSSHIDNNLKLSEKKFASMKEFDKFCKKIKVETGEIVKIEWDGEEIEFPETIFEDDVYGYLDKCHTFIHRYYPKSIESEHTHRTWFFDIETRSGVVIPNVFPRSELAIEQVTTIQIYDNFLDTYIILAEKEFTGKFEKDNVKYYIFDKEEDLLEAFIKLLEKLNPSIISGWNSKMFDMTYLTNRIARVLDWFDGSSEELNNKNSYLDMENVNRLSPVGVVNAKQSSTKDGMEGTEVFWRGRILADYRELTLKYGYLGLPSYSLSNVAKHFKLSQKIDNSQYSKFDDSYTGENYIFPEIPQENDKVYEAQLAYKEGKISKEDMQQVVYNRFIEYSVRDVEILVELDKITKYLSSQQGIAYTTSASFDDCWGVAKHWSSYIAMEAKKRKEILPLTQRFRDPNVVFLAGLVRNVPKKYEYVSSFDFTSLYPSLIMSWNIGADTFVNDIELHQELKDLREKYFYYHTLKVMNREEGLEIDGEIIPLGELVIKHDGDINDLEEETIFYKNLLDNADEIREVLQRHNVTATPNGFFYRKNKISLSSELMRRNFQDRLREKRAGQADGAKIEELKKEINLSANNEKNQQLRKEIDILTASKDLHENISVVLKILLNSYYGSMSMSHITYSNGNITASSVTTAGRMCNKMASMYADNLIKDLLGENPSTDLKYISQIDTDSFYLNVGKFINYKYADKTKEEKTRITLDLSNGIIADSNTKALDDVSYALNVIDREPLNLENEIIADGFVSLAAKRYFGRKVVEDGSILSEPKMKAVGISLVSKKTPEFLRDALGPVLEIILDGNNSDLKNYINKIRNEFAKLSPIEFCRVANVNNLSYERTGLKYKRKKSDGKLLTAPMNSHASLEYNRFIKKNNLLGKYKLIEVGEAVSYVYIRNGNEKQLYNSMAWNDPKFVDEISLSEFTDYDIHFDKDFLKKIEIVTEPMNWDIRTKTEEIDIW